MPYITEEEIKNNLDDKLKYTLWGGQKTGQIIEQLEQMKYVIMSSKIYDQKI